MVLEEYSAFTRWQPQCSLSLSVLQQFVHSSIAMKPVSFQEVARLSAELAASNRRLCELVSINRQLDADCCQLIKDKHALQMRLDAAAAGDDEDSCSVEAKVEQIHTHTHPFNGPFPRLPG